MCARFSSDSFDECSDKSIWVVLEQLDVEFVESLLERKRKEGVCEKAADDACDWVGGAQRELCGNERQEVRCYCLLT